MGELGASRPAWASPGSDTLSAIVFRTGVCWSTDDGCQACPGYKAAEEEAPPQDGVWSALVTRAHLDSWSIRARGPR